VRHQFLNKFVRIPFRPDLILDVAELLFSRQFEMVEEIDDFFE
jgi:hypothetical protein